MIRVQDISTCEFPHVLIPGGLFKYKEMMCIAFKHAPATPARASVFAGPILFLNLFDSRFIHSFWENQK